MTINEKEWFIQVPWGRLCVLAWGSCLNPPVVLCHGSLDSAATFRPLVRLLPEKFYYIGIELPGNGRSDRLPEGLMISIYDLVYVLDAVVTHFRWDHFALIAHSLGALIGKFYNLTCPNKISKFVELDPINFVAIEPEDFATWYHVFFTSFYDKYDSYNMPLEKAPKHTRKKAIESIKKVRGLDEVNAAATLERWSEPVGNGLIRYTLDQRFKLITIPPFSTDHIKTLFFNLKTPTLDIIAQNSLKKGKYRNTKFLLDEKNYPHNNYRAIKVEGGHDVHIIHPERVAPFVGQFLLGGVEAIDLRAKI